MLISFFNFYFLGILDSPTLSVVIAKIGISFNTDNNTS
jgi:hypothetical protein